jgi:CDP-paratose 2-epimerase
MSRKYLITGGAGFIGSNAAHRLIKAGHQVTVFDNLNRKGTEKNIKWLQEEHGDALEFVKGDIRNADECVKAVEGKDVIYHFAGQVAVTTSVTDPRTDFDINALGTFNMLEATRQASNNPIFAFTSTNKVYGGMEDVETHEVDGHYDYKGLPQGVPVDHPIDFHSPYGCSKGAADQYVRDYARIYNIPAFIFRMSCQYGPRQFGNEDQGWVAHFVIAASKGKGLNIYGDGKQVRDVLYVEDLCRAFDMAVEKIDTTGGKIYNIGGGRQNVMSLLELIEILEELLGKKIDLTFGEWRPGDQPVYISDVTKAKEDFGWEPSISKKQGVTKLYEWVKENPHLFDW